MCKNVCGITSGVDACVYFHLGIRGDHAGPPGVGAHLGPDQIPNDKLLTEPGFLNHRGMMDLWNLIGGIKQKQKK